MRDGPILPAMREPEGETTAAGPTTLDALRSGPPSEPTSAQPAPQRFRETIDVDRAGLRYWIVAASHVAVDMYPQAMFPLAVALQDRLSLNAAQFATVFMIGPLIGGLSQPLFAFFGDRSNFRLFAPLGLLTSCLCLTSVGWATAFWQLIALQVVGTIGNGVYHPFGAALAGRLSPHAIRSKDIRRSARSLGLSIFFAFGMLGGTLGPLAATRINQHLELRWLPVMAIPGLVFATLLIVYTRHVPHASPAPARATRADGAPPETNHFTARWVAVVLLGASNSLRFIVNIGLYFLFAEYAKRMLAEADAATTLAGNLTATSTLGMGASALVAGRLIHQGREKAPIVLTGLAVAPVIAAMPFLPPWAMYPAVLIAAVGYFSTIPTGIGLAQRLIPHATGMVGAILMGCGWAASSASSWMGEAVIRAGGDDGLKIAFFFFAGLLALSGLLAAPIPGRIMRDVAHHD